MFGTSPWKISTAILLAGMLAAMGHAAEVGEQAAGVMTPGTRLGGPSTGLPRGAAPGSISLWFARRTGAANHVLFVHGNQEQGRARGLWLVTEDTLCFYFWGWPDDLHVKIPGGIAAEKWHHVAATYDGTTARLYFDGKPIGQVETKIDTGVTGKFHVGRNLTDDGRNFDGLLDKIKVHPRALSGDEIRQTYTTELAARPAVEFPSLVSRCDVEEILFAVRQTDPDGHWYANFGHDIVRPDRKYYHDGGRLCRLNLKTGKVKTLVNDPKGGVRDPQMHYDGRKILFSYRKGGQPYYHLYEIGIDGDDMRRLTDGPYDDFEPTYLPDGGIVFCSSRCDRWVPCYFTQVAVLYRCDGDGKNIRQLSANTEQENTPWVMPDGRILYQRWEYVDRSQIGYHHLWTMNPDGTGQMVYYGNMHADTVMIDAQADPQYRSGGGLLRARAWTQRTHGRAHDRRSRQGPRRAGHVSLDQPGRTFPRSLPAVGKPVSRRPGMHDSAHGSPRQSA